jgi:hypothetical protein
MPTPELDSELEILLRDPLAEEISDEAERLWSLLHSYLLGLPPAESESSILSKLEELHAATTSEVVRQRVFREICMVASYGCNPEAKQRAREWLAQLTFSELSELCGAVSEIPVLTLVAFLESKPDPTTQTAAIAELARLLHKWPALRHSIPVGLQELFPMAVTA